MFVFRNPETKTMTSLTCGGAGAVFVFRNPETETMTSLVFQDPENVNDDNISNIINRKKTWLTLPK